MDLAYPTMPGRRHMPGFRRPKLRFTRMHQKLAIVLAGEEGQRLLCVTRNTYFTAVVEAFSYVLETPTGFPGLPAPPSHTVSPHPGKRADTTPPPLYRRVPFFVLFLTIFSPRDLQQ